MTSPHANCYGAMRSPWIREDSHACHSSNGETTPVVSLVRIEDSCSCRKGCYEEWQPCARQARQSKKLATWSRPPTQARGFPCKDSHAKRSKRVLPKNHTNKSPTPTTTYTLFTKSTKIQNIQSSIMNHMPVTLSAPLMLLIGQSKRTDELSCKKAGHAARQPCTRHACRQKEKRKPENSHAKILIRRGRSESCRRTVLMKVQRRPLLTHSSLLIKIHEDSEYSIFKHESHACHSINNCFLDRGLMSCHARKLATQQGNRAQGTLADKRKNANQRIPMQRLNHSHAKRSKRVLPKNRANESPTPTATYTLFTKSTKIQNIQSSIMNYMP